MDENHNENSEKLPNNPLKPHLSQNKKEYISLLIISLVIVIFAITYSIYLNMFDVSGNLGSSVNRTTYLEIQDLVLRKDPEAKIVEESLRSYDIDDDGDKDVLGFIKFTLPLSDNLYDSSDYGGVYSRYIFTTWYRDEVGFDYNIDKGDDFEFGDSRYNSEQSCSIINLAAGRVTLSCIEPGQQEYVITLHHAERGGPHSYYRDVDANVVTFDNDINWNKYVSAKGGISFHYPPDINISETTYEIGNELITTIVAKRDEKTIFEIHNAPLTYHYNGYGGVIRIDHEVVFLKLLDDTYLSRPWIGLDSDPERFGTFYSTAKVDKKYNLGAIPKESKLVLKKDRKYKLYTPLLREEDLHEIDNIFSSIEYIEPAKIEDEEITVLQNNLISFADVVTLQVPGHVYDRKSLIIDDTNAINQKDLDVTFIESLIFEPSFLGLKLYPFGSIGDTGGENGGGYNLEGKGCYEFNKNEITVPQKIGSNQVCRFVYGDAGVYLEGYYILDPNQKYILRIKQDRSHGYYESLHPDLEDIVESVRFSSK